MKYRVSGIVDNQTAAEIVVAKWRCSGFREGEVFALFSDTSKPDMAVSYTSMDDAPWRAFAAAWAVTLIILGVTMADGLPPKVGVAGAMLAGLLAFVACLVFRKHIAMTQYLVKPMTKGSPRIFLMAISDSELRCEFAAKDLHVVGAAGVAYGPLELFQASKLCRLDYLQLEAMGREAAAAMKAMDWRYDPKPKPDLSEAYDEFDR